MILKRTSVLLLACTVASAVFAADKKPQSPAPGEERPDDVICTTETPMGSHIKRRVCATREARDEAQKANQEAMERARRTGRGQANSEPAGPSL